MPASPQAVFDPLDDVESIPVARPQTSESNSGGSRPLTLGGITVSGGAAATGSRLGDAQEAAGSTGGSSSSIVGCTGGTITPQKIPSTDSGRTDETAAMVAAAAKKNNNSSRSSQLGDVVLRLEGIEKMYTIDGSNEPVTALRGISLHENSAAAQGGFQPVRQGEFVMIRGPSGGGKTTLLNIIGTLDSATKGTVELLGSQINAESSDTELADLRLKHLGFVFQTFNLIATMSAAENVELPMTLAATLTEKERRLRARQLLALVGLRNRVDHLPSELSGGEQQRVTIARSLANNPSLLLLDEPTGDLDTATSIDVMNLLVKMNRATRTTCIMVTHNPDLECYADRILYVSDGTFAKEVINEEPRILSLDEYLEHLNEREAQMTTEVVKREL